MPRRRSPDRVLGPYPNQDGTYRIKIVGRDSDGRKVVANRNFPTEKEAEKAAAREREALSRPEETTVQAALDQYLQQKEEAVKASSIRTTRDALLRLLRPDLARPIGRLTPDRAGELYDLLRPSYAVATHHHSLYVAREFGAWLLKGKLVRANPFAEVAPVGQAKRGKDKLRFDEARAWRDTALVLAETEDGALLALLCLLCQVRVSAALPCEVRDLDAGGSLLWVKRKGKAGEHPVKVPAALRPLLQARAKGRFGKEPLFSIHHRTTIWQWVRKICDQAAVPRVCPHSLRGLGADLRLLSGEGADTVAAALDHGVGMLRKHYADAEAIESAQQDRVLRVLDGGRK